MDILTDVYLTKKKQLGFSPSIAVFYDTRITRIMRTKKYICPHIKYDETLYVLGTNFTRSTIVLENGI